MSSGTFRISSITVPAFSRRLVSSLAFSSPPRPNAHGATRSAPIMTAFQRFISTFSFFGLEHLSVNSGPVVLLSFSFSEDSFHMWAVQMTEQRSEKKNHESKKDNFRDSRSSDCDARESENGRDERDDEKSQCPLPHLASSETVLPFFWAEIHWACGLRLWQDQVQSLY